MKVSICIPQYNRIQYLLQSLEIISKQTYDNIEVVVSDDCSTDDTEEQIHLLSLNYKYPIVYHRNKNNKGYDFNYRQCIELATGEYCVVIGNDDSIFGKESITFLVDFLKENSLPDIGYANFVEAKDPSRIIERAQVTAVLGTGAEVALQNYSCFSFVGGLIYKKIAFEKYNTAKHDGSIYAQMYLGSLMIASGCRLFSIREPIVLKDLEVEDSNRKSYKDTIARSWKDYKAVNGGLPSVMHVLISAFRDAKALNQRVIYKIFTRIYSKTYPFWILDYKANNAFPEAVGLVQGLRPGNIGDFNLLSNVNKIKIYLLYLTASGTAIVLPSFIFNKFKGSIYSFFKGKR